jgi:hypothetical protein
MVLKAPFQRAEIGRTPDLAKITAGSNKEGQGC